MMKKAPLYKSIQDEIEGKILDGTYSPGHKLMPENDMTEHYGVSRITVRNAMDNLVKGNLVERVRGKGTFVRDISERGNDKSIPAKSTKTIAFIVPVLNDRHTINIFDSFYHEVSSKGFSLKVYQTYHTQKLEESIIAQCLKDKLDGLVIYPIQGEKYNEEIIKLALSRYPAVLIDRTLEGINIDSVVTDNEKAAYEAALYLIEKGHRKIGFLSSDVEYALTLKERYRGYLRALEEKGLDTDSRLIYFYDGFAENNKLDTARGQYRTSGSLEEYLNTNKDLTAVLTSEPQETKLLIETAKHMNLSLPRDISLIGFDDFNNAELFEVPPTVIQQDCLAIGKTAFALLEKQIKGESSAREPVRIEAEMIERKTVSINK